jgi:succinoglycan biosynthesis transport protein ExoP
MNFQQYITLIWSRKRLAITCLTITVIATLIVSMLLPKQYIATTDLVLDQRGIDPITGNVLPTQLISGYMETQIDIISSHNVAHKVATALKLDEDPKLRADFEKKKESGDIHDWIADNLLTKLNAKPFKLSNIVKISYSSPDPKLSAQLANAFAQAYIQTTVELKVQVAKLNADWFDAQLNNLRKNLENAQNKSLSCQQTNGIVTADERLDLENEHLLELSRELSESQRHTYELISRKKQLDDAMAGKQSLESLEEILNSGLIQQLKGELARVEGKFAELSVRVDKNHPEYKQAQAEMSSLKKRLHEEIGTVVNGISGNVAASQQRNDTLAMALNEQKNKVLELKEHNNELAVLNREVENAQRVYDTATQQSFQARMESEITQTDIAILNMALPPQKPASPKIFLNLMLSTFLGTIFGVGAVFIAEQQDRRVRSPMDIRDNLDLPVLGILTIPSKNNKKTRWIFTM